MSKYEMADDILLMLAKALREVDSLSPKCSIDLIQDDVKVGELEWNQDHLIFSTFDPDPKVAKVTRILGLNELDKDSKEFLEACLRLWLIQGDDIHRQIGTTRPEA